MTDMDTEESEANKEGDVMASIGATVSKKDDKTDLRAILMEIKTSKKKTHNSSKKWSVQNQHKTRGSKGSYSGHGERVQAVEDATKTTNPSLKTPNKKDAPTQQCQAIWNSWEWREKCPTIKDFVENLLREYLQLPSTLNLHTERAHRALPPPRSIIVRFLSYKKEEIL